jgi:hypothetical protein
VLVKTAVRIFLAVALGNLIGYGFFRLAAWAAPQWWQSAPRPMGFSQLLLMIGITAIAFGTPPMIVSALAARLAGRYEPATGLAAALWGVTARQWWPEQVPLLPPESWVAPMTLILLSGLLGGWFAGGGLPHRSRTGESPLPPDSGAGGDVI